MRRIPVNFVLYVVTSEQRTTVCLSPLISFKRKNRPELLEGIITGDGT
jgi:hypothetical protein